MTKYEYRNQWGRLVYTGYDSERALRTCQCGCGGVIPDSARKDKVFINNTHRMRNTRKASKTHTHKCPCGCGKDVTGDTKRYYSNACRQRAYRQRRAFENAPQGDFANE